MRRISLFFIAGVIAIAVYLGVNSFKSLTSQSEDDVVSLQLDYDGYSKGINTILYDAQGTINYTLQAEGQIHFTDDRTELEKPFIRLYEGGNSRWNIVANSGKISPLREQGKERIQTIELSGDIEVYSLDALGNRMQLTTDHLTVNPLNKTMETDRLVTVVTDSIQLTSTGMFADLMGDAVVFKRETQGSYEKPSIEN